MPKGNINTRLRLKVSDVNLDNQTLRPIIQAVTNETVKLSKNPELRIDIGQAYIGRVTKYVPMKTGELRNGAIAQRDGRVIWTATSTKNGYDYARSQYYELFMGNSTKSTINYTTPGTHSEWTNEVQPGTPDWDLFVKDLSPLIAYRLQRELINK